MHPALIRYVEPPPRHTARYFALGIAAGTIALVSALGLVAVAETAYLGAPASRDHVRESAPSER